MAFTVYCLTNGANGKRYVGQTQSLKQRMRQHRTGGSGHCRALCAAVKKYGFDRFSMKVLSRHSTREEANAAERAAIVRLGSLAPGGYNLRSGGHDRNEFSSDSIELMRVVAKKRGVSPQCREAARRASTGRTLSAHVRESVGRTWRGKKRPDHTKALLSYYEDPSNRAAHSERMRAWWAERKKATA